MARAGARALRRRGPYGGAGPTAVGPAAPGGPSFPQRPRRAIIPPAPPPFPPENEKAGDPAGSPASPYDYRERRGKMVCVDQAAA